MSEDLGPMVYGQKEELIFLGREISEQRDYSESIAEKIDAEVRVLVQEAYKRAKEILQQYRAQLDAIAARLIEIETIDKEEFLSLFDKPVPEKNSGTPILSNA
jgi:cell division protease FtsH